MIIDEVLSRIKYKFACDYNINGCDTCDISSCEDRDIIIQLSEWLEELKELRKFKNDFTDLGKLYSEIRLEERNKAINDLENKILNNCTSKYIDGERVIVVRNDIFKFILEQLKGRYEE